MGPAAIARLTESCELKQALWKLRMIENVEEAGVVWVVRPFTVVDPLSEVAQT